MNPTLHTFDDHSVLRFERRLAHPVEKVWRAVTDPAELAHWFPSRVEVDPRVGGAVRFASAGDKMDPAEGVVTELDPPRVFAFTWNGDPLRFELTPDGDGTLLVFTHGFGDRPMAGSFAAGWQTCLGALAQILADPSGEVSIVPERYAERHDALVAAFGLGEGTVESGPEGEAIRFVRLLPHPVEHVWSRLAAGAPVAGGPPPAAITGGHVRAGTLTEVTEHRVLEYTWPSGGAARVRWELTGGHPAGTRVTLTERGAPADLACALAAWQARLEFLAGDLRGQPGGASEEDRAAELEKHYAGRLEAR